MEERCDDGDLDDFNRDDERQETGSTPSDPLFDTDGSETLTCLRTGLAFQTSSSMKLLAIYEDGVTPSAALAGFQNEQVFCRICREGLHDDADEEQPTAATENDRTDPLSSSNTSDTIPAEPEGVNLPPIVDLPADAMPTTTTLAFNKGPVHPHPPYTTNTDALGNPLLAPCECSGSMAFVHYLCVEQWRCRSRHPDAHHGLQCETCASPYCLPPPSERPARILEQQQQQLQEDWLDAMPPHVMQALRQPHFCWQIGAAMVRRRWLRPLAPVLLSPIVALYCRARRMLKKRGVARRRWACSLCRRRARWKCVRCLRSYYCSRQCQNVSWHIVHKHVCYKPARLWSSVVVYGAATLAVFPGILRDPLMYDLGLCLVPLSFVMIGIICGGLAIIMKKAIGIDMRGRGMETAVLLFTCYLSVVSWGIVKGFFGNPSACWGAFGQLKVQADATANWYMLYILRRFLLTPASLYYKYWDSLPRKVDNAWFQSAVCVDYNSTGCFEHLPNANPNFFLDEHNGGKCAADVLGVAWLYLFAGFNFVGCALWKQHERQRRHQARRPARVPHAHED
jgi:hypothetical protein